jgi:hypothetical protein
MAFSSSSSTHPAAISLGLVFIPVNEKLTRSNYQSWHAQVLAAIRGAQAEEYIQPEAKPPAKFVVAKNSEGKEESALNPDYCVRVANDQQVLSYQLTSLSKEILGHVNTEVSVAGAWAAIHGLFVTQSRARVIAHMSAPSSTSLMSISGHGRGPG